MKVNSENNRDLIIKQTLTKHERLNVILDFQGLNFMVHSLPSLNLNVFNFFNIIKFGVYSVHSNWLINALQVYNVQMYL